MISPSIFKNLIFIFCLFLFNKADSKTLYVSLNGNDSNNGLSIEKSFKSINKAVKLSEAGDTIFILPGTYREIISFNKKNGFPEKSINLLGYSNNEKDFPIIDGGAKKPTADSSSYWAFINNSSWLKIGKIKFKNAWAYPILLKNSSYISFDSCYFWGGKRVINAEGNSTHHLLVENCYWDQGGEFLWKVKKDSLGVDAWLSMHHKSMSYFNGSLIDFHNTGGSIVIRNNTIVNAFNALRWRGVKGYDSNIEIYNNNISFVRDNDFEPEVYTYNLHIYHNFSHNIHRTLSIDNVNGGYIYYYGNVITTDNDPWTQKICVSFWKIYGKERNLSYPLYAFNNSFYGTGSAFKVDVGDLLHTKHFNNAYFFSLDDNGWSLNKFDSTDEFNYDISNRKWPGNIIKNNQEKHGKITDIKFVDPLNKDLRLQKNSPGIDAGKIISFDKFNWKQSFKGKAPDIGAYEGDKLVEGPPFRFLIPSDSKINYKEKPRIVRYRIKKNILTLFFSDKINIDESKDCNINVFENGDKVKVDSLWFENKYQLNVLTNKNLNKNNISVSFNKMPIGENGESATYWASNIKINK